MTVSRKFTLTNNETYHIYTRSIAGFEIFRSQDLFQRFLDTVIYYNNFSRRLRYSKYVSLSPEARERVDQRSSVDPVVQIIAYCIMPTHIHLALKQVKDGGISYFMKNVLDSFSRYFNTSHNRKGPLWESRFKNVLVDSDEQLLHLTRYIHLNPSSASLVSRPEDWKYSSYNEYVEEKTDKAVCIREGLLDISPIAYRSFVKRRISYQRSLSVIKHLLFDNYNG